MQLMPDTWTEALVAALALTLGLPLGRVAPEPQSAMIACARVPRSTHRRYASTSIEGTARLRHTNRFEVVNRRCCDGAFAHLRWKEGVR